MVKLTSKDKNEVITALLTDATDIMYTFAESNNNTLYIISALDGRELGRWRVSPDVENSGVEQENTILVGEVSDWFHQLCRLLDARLEQRRLLLVAREAKQTEARHIVTVPNATGELIQLDVVLDSLSIAPIICDDSQDIVIPIKGRLGILRDLMNELVRGTIPGVNAPYEFVPDHDRNRIDISFMNANYDTSCGHVTAKFYPNNEEGHIEYWLDETDTSKHRWRRLYDELTRRGFIETKQKPTELMQPEKVGRFTGVGISSELLQRLREALRSCGPFESDSDLGTIFIDQRISTWRDDLPESNSKKKRVNSTLKFLLEEKTDAGENALILFLQVLSDSIDPQDACKQNLIQLACELEQELRSDR